MASMDRDAMYRPGQAAEQLHISRRTLSDWARRGLLPFFETPGGHRRFPMDAVAALRQHLARPVLPHGAPWE